MYDIDAPGVGRFVTSPIRIPMASSERPSLIVTFSVYQLPWREQFCFWVDQKPGKELLFERLHQGFERTGGVPEHLFVPGVRPFSRKEKQDVVWLRSFERFCRHYGCRPQPCTRPKTLWMRQVRQCVDGHDWTTVADCQRALTALAQSLSEGPVPNGLGLQPMPKDRFVCHKDTPCRVGSDGFARYAGDYYSLPAPYVGKTLWARRTGDIVAFNNDNELRITDHKVGRGCGDVRLCLSHFDFVNSPELVRAIKAWRGYLPGEEQFIERLVAQRKLGSADTMRSILALVQRLPKPQQRHLLDQCTRYNNYSHRFVQGLLDTPARVPSHKPAPLRTAQQLLF